MATKSSNRHDTKEQSLGFQDRREVTVVGHEYEVLAFSAGIWQDRTKKVRGFHEVKIPQRISNVKALSK